MNTVETVARVGRAACIAAIALAAPALTAAAPRVNADLDCVSFGTGPKLECTVKLRTADGKPLTGATVTLSATMPSMPMAHHVKAATAAATGTPGEYRGQLVLEMTGAWAVQVDVAGPVRDRFARTLKIDECEGDGRCPAVPAKAATAPAAHKH